MPLDNGGFLICHNCGLERTVRRQDWLLDPTDHSVFTSPSCPTCRAQETFCWHDFVQSRIVQEERPVSPEHPDGPQRSVVLTWEEPDPDNFDARHMVSIESVARTLGLQRKAFPEQPHRAYGRNPRPHSREELKENVRQRQEQRAAPPPPTRQSAEAAYEALLADSADVLARRTEALEEVRARQVDRVAEEEPAVSNEPVIDKPRVVRDEVRPTRKPSGSPDNME